MKKVLLFFLCLSAKILLAQTDSNLVSMRYVLATVLNMRAKPSKNAKVIAKIPKYSQVEELENLSRVDNIESVTIGEFGSKWSKIKYQNKIGYVANYYLGQPVIIDRFGTIPININYPYWYQIELKNDGDYLRNIEVQLDTLTDDANGGRIFIVEKTKKAENRFTLQFGSFIAFKTGKISNFYQNCYENREKEEEENDNEFNYEDKCAIRIKDENLPVFIKSEPRFKNYYFERKGNEIYFHNDKGKQLILSEEGFCEVFWFGDLDNDGKPDFILKNNFNISLFLSSKAKKGNFVQMISQYYYEDGC